MERKKGSFEICPLRSLDDFLLDSARFQIPNIKDPDKWANRVIRNLLYYQTNYFMLGLVIFTTVGVLHPVDLFYGMTAFGVGLGITFYIFLASGHLSNLKSQYPILSIVFVLLGGYFIFYVLGSVIVFLHGVLLPVMVCLIHASFRLRSIRNKLYNKKELLTDNRTPMGILLSLMGSELS